MLVEKRENVLWADIYWNDLSAETQAELLNLIGDNGNYDVFPIVSVNISHEGG
jgi:hypothetical protein